MKGAFGAFWGDFWVAIGRSKYVKSLPESLYSPYIMALHLLGRQSEAGSRLLLFLSFMHRRRLFLERAFSV